MTQAGYLIIAFGADRYLHMASACAASLRGSERRYPCQLVTDREDLGEYRSDFEHVTLVKEAPDFVGPLAKLKAWEYSIFDRTMFVDCDCLCIPRRIDEEWARLDSTSGFAMQGRRAKEGPWYGMDISDMLPRFDVPYVIKMNSGAFFFTKDEASKEIFDCALELLEVHGNFTNHVHRGTTPPDEPYLGIALGMKRFRPEPQIREGGRAWMVSTLRSSAFDFDFIGGRASFQKVDRSVQPAITHFVGRRPNELYLREINRLRARDSRAPLEEI